MRVRGIDGCKRGWVAIDLLDGAFFAVRVSTTLREVCDDAVGVIAVDIPIGLLDGVREADRSARGALGPRRASVFPAPPRSALGARTFAEANRIARTFGSGLSQQAYGLLAKIREADALASDARIHEVHPELSFRELSGAPLAHAKRSWRGQHLRRALLARAGIELPDDLNAANDVPCDDVLDAAAAAWSAARIARGAARTYPPVPSQRDGARTIAIWT